MKRETRLFLSFYVIVATSFWLLDESMLALSMLGMALSVGLFGLADQGFLSSVPFSALWLKGLGVLVMVAAIIFGQMVFYSWR